MNNKIHLSKKWILLLVVVLAAIPFFIKWRQAEHPGANLIQWDDVHKSRVEGECADCHSDLEFVESKVVPGKTPMIPPPKSHTEQFLRFTHGKSEKLGSHSCAACHEAQECTDCHAIMPESHSADFVHPRSDSIGTQRHIALGRADITACYTCHRDLNQTCTTCHDLSETSQWQSKASEEITRWKDILGVDF